MRTQEPGLRARYLRHQALVDIEKIRPEKLSRSRVSEHERPKETIAAWMEMLLDLIKRAGFAVDVAEDDLNLDEGYAAILEQSMSPSKASFLETLRIDLQNIDRIQFGRFAVLIERNYRNFSASCLFETKDRSRPSRVGIEPQKAVRRGKRIAIQGERRWLIANADIVEHEPLTRRHS